jgi:hypothetical protein
MKKYLLLLLFGGLLSNVMAQISIQPVLPLAGMVQKNNLWNIAVINTSGGSYDCRVELTLRDRSTGLEVLTAITGTFLLSGGAKQLSAPILAPLQYNYISTTTNRRDDFIPIGNYTACYRLTTVGKTIVSEECVAFDVEPLSPPMLITPADSSVLEVAPSQFSWVPPAPMNLFSRLDYDVVITEILPGQKAQEAVQQNLPFYTEPNVSINNLSYKGAVTNFEKDKWYAWQVTAKDDKNYAGKSEVWVFKITNDPKVTTPTSDFYLLMDDEIRGTYKLSSNNINVKYTSQNSAFDAAIIFTDDEGRVIKTTKQNIKQGDNYFNFSLGNQFKQNKVYAVTIKDQNNKARTITFSIHTK